MELSDQARPFWRDIILHAIPGRVDAEVADNVHHFRVVILHDEVKVLSVSASAERVPWVTCPAAALQLSRLAGTPVRRGPRKTIDQSRQCTHMLDLARLGIAHIARGGGRRFRVSIHYDAARRGVVAALSRDGAPFVEWLTRAGVVVSKGAFEGHDTRGRSAWSAEVESDDDLREAGLILRRCLFIFRSRDFSATKYRAAELQDLRGVCHSFQSEQAVAAVRPADFRELP